MNGAKKVFQNRIVLGVICIVIAAIVIFVLTPIYNRELAKTKDVVVVTEDILLGESITADKLSVITVGGYNLPDNIATTIESVTGAYAATDLHAGDYIFPGKIRKDPVLKNEYLGALDGSLVAISITIPYYAAGLSDKLEAGDIITVICSDVGDDKQTIIPVELTYVRILAVSDDIGSDLKNSYVDHDLQDTTEIKNIATLTLLVTDNQARLLVDIERNAKFHAALVYRGEEGKAKEFLAMQTDILADIEAGEVMPTVIVPNKSKDESILDLSAAEIEQMGLSIVSGAVEN